MEEWIEYGSGFIGGGVWLREQDPTRWVNRNPVAALEFALAGSVAEDVVWGHWLEGGFRGDVDCWRRGVGLIGASSNEEVDAALGRPFATVLQDTRRWVRDRFGAIRKVVSAMTGVDATMGVVEINVALCRSLEEGEVRELVSD